MAASHIAVIAAPLASVSSGVRSIAELDAPPALGEPIGAVLGHSPTRSPIHLAQTSRSGGVAIFGIPNSGKSILMRRVWAFDLLDRQRGPLVDGSCGDRNTMIAIAAKADDAAAQLAWCHAFRQRVYLVDIFDPATCAIDLFSSHKPPHERAVDAVNMFTYIFGEDAIGNVANPALKAVMGGAFVAHDHPELFAGITTEPPSPIHTARMLIARGDQGRELGRRILEFADAHETTHQPAKTGNSAGDGDVLAQPHSDIGRAGERLAHYLSMNAGDFRRQFESSANKIAQLADVEEWFGRDRPKLTWRQALDDHLVVVVNAGRPINPNVKPSTYDTKMVNALTAATLCSLRQTIAERCDGWQDTGRAVSIYSDEISQVAPPDSDQADADLRWMRDQGRAFGVRLALATQYPEQLSPRMRNSLKGFDTKIWMQQSNDAFMEEGARDLGGESAGISPADLRSLPRFHGLIATRIHGQALQPCVVNVAMSEPGGVVDAGGFVDDHHQQ